MTEQKIISIKKALYLFWIYTLLVILWGAWVRISHSGNGCGDHWPLCNGDIIPAFDNTKTMTEFLHRIMSGLYGLIVIYIFLKFRKNENNTVRKLSLFLLIFMIIEALIGALLVKKSLVTVNDSIARLIVMSFHQLNSFLLTGTTFLLALLFGQKNSEQNKIQLTKFQVILLVVAISGAIASLAATLFPTTSILEGIVKDFSSDSHLFIKLRGLHPFLAITLISYIIYRLSISDFKKAEAQKLIYKLLFALVIGILTILTLSPIWLKLTHLLIAHYLWAETIKYNIKI